VWARLPLASLLAGFHRVIRVSSQRQRLGRDLCCCIVPGIFIAWLPNSVQAGRRSRCRRWAETGVPSLAGAGRAAGQCSLLLESRLLRHRGTRGREAAVQCHGWASLSVPALAARGGLSLLRCPLSPRSSPVVPEPSPRLLHCPSSAAATPERAGPTHEREMSSPTPCQEYLPTGCVRPWARRVLRWLLLRDGSPKVPGTGPLPAPACSGSPPAQADLPAAPGPSRFLPLARYRTLAPIPGVRGCPGRWGRHRTALPGDTPAWKSITKPAGPLLLLLSHSCGSLPAASPLGRRAGPGDDGLSTATCRWAGTALQSGGTGACTSRRLGSRAGCGVGSFPTGDRDTPCSQC